MSKKAPGKYQQLDRSGAEDSPAVYPDPPPVYSPQTVSLEVDDAPPKQANFERHKVFVSHNDPLPPEPSHYLVCSVLATIFCCGICGFIAVVMGLLVGQRYNRRDYPAARRFSGHAKLCTILSLIFGVIFMITTVTLWIWWYKVIFVGLQKDAEHLQDTLMAIIQQAAQQQGATSIN